MEITEGRSVRKFTPQVSVDVYPSGRDTFSVNVRKRKLKRHVGWTH